MSDQIQEKTLTLSEIINGLKDGSITLLENNHSCNSLIEQLEDKLESENKHIKEYEEKISQGILKDGDVECQGMIDFYNIRQQCRFGSYIMDIENYCFSCDGRLYVVLLDEKTIGYIPSSDYWKTAEASGKKYGYKAKTEDCKCCSAQHLNEAGKLVTEIQVPSGKLIFQNYFETPELYDYQGEGKYKKTSICSVLGRNELMQHLATKNVGYGQMGNMSVNIYSNGSDVIVGNGLDNHEDNKYYYDEHPEELNDEAKESLAKGEAFQKELEDGGYKDLGEISLSVWRWMCMDAKLLAKHKEKPNEDAIAVKVPKGTYVIEHYFDFSHYSEYVYSRIKIK